MNASLNQVAQSAVARLLRPLVRMLLRYGIPYGAFADIAKRIYVDVAMEEAFQLPGRKPTISRASVITGLSRKEVLRVTRLPDLDDQGVVDRYNRAVRVISGWVRDPVFHDEHGEPAALPLANGMHSFQALARRYSGDVPHRAVLDELERVGAVEQTEGGTVRLAAQAYVPAGGEQEKLGILGTDVADLIATIDHNLQAQSPQRSRLQLKVAYDNLPGEPLKRFKDDASARAWALLRELDTELAAVDRDTNPAVEGTGRHRAGVAIYYFEEDLAATEGSETT